MSAFRALRVQKRFPISAKRNFSLSTSACSPIRPSVSQMPNMMDIGSRAIYNEEHDMFRENVRRFMRDELGPAQASFEEQGRPTKEIWEKLGAQGLLGVSIPAEAGGIGGSFKDEAIVLEEQVYSNSFSPAITVHSTINLPYFLHYGTKDQIEKYMPDFVAGKKVSAIAMTEPDAGSDLQGMRTRTVKDGDDFILNGSKTFITNGILADVVIVCAITDANAKSKAHGISLLIVEEGMPGFKRGRNLKKLGLKGQDTAELFFEDVRVPKENVLGGENKGFYQLMTELPQERLGIAITSAAHCEWMFETTREYLINRKAFGNTLSSLQTIQHRLAEMKTKIAVTRAFIDECIELHDQKKLSNESASMAKYWATDLENKIAAECVQLHGGWGYMWETCIARSYANARVQTIYGGTNEIMKELIARNIVKPQK